MGKKGSWFSAIKRVFISHSKEKLGDEPDKKSSKEKKKKGVGRLRHGETNSFIPLFRGPSSIEKILGEAERENKLVFRPPTPPEQPRTPTFVPSTHRPASPRSSSQRIASPKVASPPSRAPIPRAASPPPRVPSPRVPPPPQASSVSPPPRAPSPKAAPPPPRAPSPKAAPPPPRAPSPRAASPRNIRHHRPEPTLRNHHASATKIQAAYRGYMARRSFRALKGLVRLQGVIRGQNVKRQTTNAMKHMQLLVRVQSQIQSRRIQMLENQALRQAQYRNDKEAESTLSKWTFGQSEAGNHENWDDSVLTKEEIEARMQRKVEAVMKRERAMAYAYSHQLWKGNPKSAQTLFSDIRSGGFPWWWNWLDRQLRHANPSEGQGIKNFQLTPPRPASEMKPSPKPYLSSKQHHFGFELDASTPKSSKSSFLPVTKPAQTPPSFRTPRASTSGLSKYSRPRASGAGSPFELLLKDDDSLTSCPPFSVPSYMAPTVSAKAKVRASSNPKERIPVTPKVESNKRRFSFPLAQGIGSFKWNNKGSSSSHKALDRHQSLQSIGNLSVDSTVSMPATVGRKPFNRFV